MFVNQHTWLGIPAFEGVANHLLERLQLLPRFQLGNHPQERNFYKLRFLLRSFKSGINEFISPPPSLRHVHSASLRIPKEQVGKPALFRNKYVVCFFLLVFCYWVLIRIVAKAPDCIVYRSFYYLFWMTFTLYYFLVSFMCHCDASKTLKN